MAKAEAFITDLAAEGRIHFTSDFLRTELGLSGQAARAALSRLARKGCIASPARGFYLIVPPEDRILGCLPAEEFLPSLMAHEGRRYYAGLLTAGENHSAAHQHPQVFQVMLEKNRRPVRCGDIRIEFYARKRLAEVPVQSADTESGTMLISTPEATAVDLAGYPLRSAGLSNVATVLIELVEVIDPEKLVEAARTAPLTWAQRLGYLLDFVGASDSAEPLRAYVRDRAPASTPLMPLAPFPAFDYARDWRVRANVQVDPDI